MNRYSSDLEEDDATPVAAGPRILNRYSLQSYADALARVAAGPRILNRYSNPLGSTQMGTLRLDHEF